MQSHPADAAALILGASAPAESCALSPRHPGRSLLFRLAAHVLIRLLLIGPWPAQWQAAAALFPASILWPLVAPHGAEPGKTEAAWGKLELGGVASEDSAGPKTRVRGSRRDTAACVEAEAQASREPRPAYRACRTERASDSGKAFFYVMRRREVGKDAEGKPQVVFETLDHAMVENGPDGKPAKVVTASYPFLGLVALLAVDYVFLMWSYDAQQPGRALPGTITGKVLRTKWDPGAQQPSYEPVQGAQVSGVDAAGNPLNAGNALVTTSGADGTYTLWDSAYTGGTVTIAVTVDAVTRTATAYEANPQDWSSTALRFYKNIAQANVTFPPIEPPPPPPAIGIDVMLHNSDGSRTKTNGFVVVGTPLLVGIKAVQANQTLAVSAVQIQGATYGVQGPLSGDANGFTHVVDGDFTPSRVGSYSVQVTGLPAFGPPVSSSYSFVAIAAGGGNTTPLEGPPTVVTAQVAPKKGATGVPVAVFPQVVFSEPVTNVSTSTVTLSELNADGTVGAAVAIALSGVGQDGLPRVPVTAADVITSLTVQPVQGLKYNQHYQLALGSGIHDVDRDATGTLTPHDLAPFRSDFTTFGPEALGVTGDVASPGIVVLENRAYLVQNTFIAGYLHAYDTTDPVSPQEIPTDATPNLDPPVWTSVTNRPVDIAAEDRSMLVVATSSTNASKPSNLYVFDVSNEAGGAWRPHWTGVASVSSGAADGFLARVAVKGSYAYTITSRKGLQVVDLNQAVANFEQVMPWNSGPYWNMVRTLNTDGQGFGQDAVVATIPVKKSSGTDWFLSDIKVGSYRVDGGEEPQPAMVVAGEPALLVANPQSQQVVFNAGGSLDTTTGQLGWSSAVALGTIAGKDVALVGGYGKLKDPPTGAVIASSAVLAVVDMTDPRNPRALSFAALSELPTDIVLKDTDALVGLSNSVQVVSLKDLARPVVVGSISNAGGRLGLGENGVLFSTGHSVFGGASAMNGVHTAALGAGAFVTRVRPDPTRVSAGDEVFEDTNLEFRLIPADPAITAAEVHIDVRDGGRVATLPGIFQAPGVGSAVWPRGTIVNLTRTYDASAHAVSDGQQLPSFPKQLHFDKVPLVVTTRDRMVRIQFALPEQGLFTERRYSVNVYLAAQGQDFPANPSFSVWSQEIEAAYPNREVWWDDLPTGSGKTTASWVVSRIDDMSLPPGTDTSIRRQAFEIGTVFAGYPKLKVVVVSDETGKPLKTLEGVVTPDFAWSEVLERVTNRIQASAGVSVSADPVIPPADSFDPSNLFGQFKGLVFRVGHSLDRAYTSWGFTFLGMMDGFLSGIEGDKQAIGMLKTAFTQDPRTTARSIADFFSAVWKALPSVDDLKRFGRAMFQEALDSPLDEAKFFSGLDTGFYAYGFFIGFVLEQALVAAILAGATGGLAALGKFAVQSALRVGWIAGLAAEIAAVIKSLGWGLELVLGTRQGARLLLSFLRENASLLGQFYTYYKTTRIDRIVKGIVRVSVASRAVAARTIYWLTFTNRMGEEAGLRFVRFFEKNLQTAELWMLRWRQLRNSQRAIKDAFEAYDRTGEIAEAAHDVMVVAADRINPPDVPSENLVRRYADKYRATAQGDRVESSLLGLRRSAEDARFDDEAIAETIRFHADPEVAAWSDDAVEGTARVTRIPCTRVAALILAAVVIPAGGCGVQIPGLVKAQYPDLVPRLETALANLKLANDVAADEAFARLLWAAHHADPEVAQAVIRAASFPSASPASVAEYFKAVDFMRDSQRAVISGLLDPAETVLGSSVNVKRVGNLGAGSIAEGFEPVAMKRLIDGGSPTLHRAIQVSDIDSFGMKLDVSAITGGTPRTIEADCLLKDGTFFDMKHSLTADPYVTAAQIDTLELVLRRPGQSPITRAYFVTSAPVGDALLTRIYQANERLKAALGITEDLIRVIEDVGRFP